MRPPDDTPLFNLKVVVQETGLKPDTLRAWERRYGMPRPERTGGGHRLYSQRDIATLKWLVARQDEGLSISRAVELWQRQAAEGQDPLLSTAEPVHLESGTAGAALAALRQSWVAACLRFDEQGAEQAVLQAFSSHLPETVCFDLLQRGLSEIGEGWYANKVTVQQEHFASALAIRRLSALLAGMAPPIRPGRILVLCPPSEQHVFSLLLLTYLLRRQGWNVLYLGANVPLSRLETTIEMIRPQLAILVAMHLQTAATALEMGLYLLEKNIPMAYGGLIFKRIPGLETLIPGHYLGDSLEEAPQRVEQIMMAPRPAPARQTISPVYLAARHHFEEQQPYIEGAVASIAPAMSRHHLSLANLHLGQRIVAALTLGDMDLLDEDMNWLQTMLVNYELPAGVLPGYLNAYQAASATHLDERGRPILDWLARFKVQRSEQP